MVPRLALLALLALSLVEGLAPAPAEAQDGKPDAYFAEEVWAKVGERTCLNCHTARGRNASCGCRWSRKSSRSSSRPRAVIVPASAPADVP